MSNRLTGRQNVHSTSRWFDSREDKQLRRVQTNTESEAMLHLRLRNKICSLPRRALNSEELPFFLPPFKGLKQITVGGGARFLQVFLIKVWQRLTSWSNKSVIMACFSLALLKRKYCTIFINIGLPVFRRMFSHRGAPAQIFLY